MIFGAIESLTNKHHCWGNGVKLSTNWGCRPYNISCFPCKATFLGFWWSLWAFSPANLHQSDPTWIQAHLHVTHNARFDPKQKWHQSDKGAVDGWLPSAKRAHIWTSAPLMTYYTYTKHNSGTTKIIQMRREFEHNPHKYLSNTPVGVQASAGPTSWFPQKSLSCFQFASGMCVSASVHWVVEKTQQHSI